MVTALYPGSFDPVTNGHVDVAGRASALFDRVIVGVYATPSKNLLFDADDRVDLFRRAVDHLPNVEVRKFEGLVVRFAQEVGAKVIVRGLRSGSDFEYEFDMAFMNRRLAPDVDMVSFMASQEYMFVSSSLLKEVARLGGNITSMVPDHVVKAVHAKFANPARGPRPGRGTP
ncbi:MAG TPA: pantetheine-phosphate adenylyltransferase [Dehalococcoidia bacterium]|nr:pantetheine-phosphate adenylyltransferase [Dehalococcoidia bacterium]